MRTFFGLVGLGMFLGFGAIFVGSWQDLRAYPSTPLKTTVHEAVLREDPGPGAWVELTDVRFPCDQPEQFPSSTHYRLGFGASEADRIIVSGLRPCSDAPVSVVGVLASASPGRIVGLAFPGYDFDHWPRAWQSTLWTESGPDDARIGLILMPPFALLGLVVLAFFWKPEPTRNAKLENLEPDPTPWRKGEQVLPARPLQLAQASLYDRVLSFTALLIMGWLLLVLAWFSTSDVGGVFGWILGAFFGVLGGFLVFAAVRAALSWRRNSSPTGPRTEALALLLTERPLDAVGINVDNPMAFGSLVVNFTHPLTSAPMERVIGAQEARPLVVNGYLFLVWSVDPNAVMIIGEDFSPYDLTPAEQRDSLRKLARWVASVK